MKDFTSKGISLENMVGETPGKEKGMTGKTHHPKRTRPLH